MSGRRDAQSGFTLVEALVSLFVFSLIASGCVIMLMQSVSSQQRVEAAHSALRELQAARALMSADLLQIAPRFARDDGHGHLPVFAGAGGEAVAFVRALAEPDETYGAQVNLVQVTYVIEGNRIVRRTRAAPDDPETTERVVFSEIEDARFAFFDGRGWSEAWASASSGALPRAVAIEGRVPRYGRIRIEAMTGAR